MLHSIETASSSAGRDLKSFAHRGGETTDLRVRAEINAGETLKRMVSRARGMWGRKAIENHSRNLLP